MPKIKIIEQDFTAAAAAGIENIVFIPVKLASVPSELLLPQLFSTISAFRVVFGDPDSSEGSLITDGSDYIVESLISAGLQVLVQGVTQLDGEVDWTKTGLGDKSLYDIRFLTAGLFEDEYDTENEKMLTCAALRGDCIALCDHVSSLDDADSISAVASTLTLNGEFGAMFTPWVKFSAALDAPAFPGSFAYLLAFANSIKRYPTWLAAAGPERGVIPGLVAPVVEFGSAAIDTLQARAEELDGPGDNVGIAVNPICFIKPFGYLVWGNRTLKLNTAGTTALSFLNIRNLACDLKKVLYRAARRLTFEQNSTLLWVKFTAAIYPTLDAMVSGNGIEGYKVFKQTTDAKARLKAVIRISPIEAVEDYEFAVVFEDDVTVITE